MAKNKYTIPGQSVQDVMNNPPRNIIFWGNGIIFLLTLIVIGLTNYVYVPEKVVLKENLSGEMRSISHNKTIILLPVPEFKNIQVNQKAFIYLTHELSSKTDTLECTVDTIFHKNGHDIAVLQFNDHPGLNRLLKAGGQSLSSADIEIVTYRSFLSKLLNQLNNH